MPFCLTSIPVVILLPGKEFDDHEDQWFPTGPGTSARIWLWHVLLQNTFMLSYTERSIPMGKCLHCRGRDEINPQTTITQSGSCSLLFKDTNKEVEELSAKRREIFWRKEMRWKVRNLYRAGRLYLDFQWWIRWEQVKWGKQSLLSRINCLSKAKSHKVKKVKTSKANKVLGV